MAISATKRVIREGAVYSARTRDVQALAAEVQNISDRLGQLTEVLTTTKAVAATESGTHFVLNTVTAFTTTLPLPAAGLEYWFHIGATAPTTTHIIATNGGADLFAGNIVTPDVNGAVVAVVALADKINFIANLAIHGDFAHVWSDGTHWYLDGWCFVQTGITTTKT